MVAIGIDLGTTYCCVGVWQHDKVEIIVNDQGNRTTPSFVAFSNRERLIGDAAKSQVAINPTNTVFDAKRMIGRRYEDVILQSDMKHWPFKVVNDCSKPRIQVEYKSELKTFAPEEISSMLLLKLKESAEAYLDTTIRDVVITVPAYFSDSQRQATKDAGAIAGLNVLRIINEPTAAALAYGLDQNIKGEKNILIFDLGGGTFDVSVLTVVEGKFFEVKATAGDTHLGGEDFDTRLVYHLAKEFKKKFKQDILKNPKALRRLRSSVEKAKCLLSSSNEAAVEVDALCDGKDFYTKISRAKFEELCADLFRSTLKPLEQALNDARLEKSAIHDVVLVGGSTRIPKIQTLLQNFFNGKTLNLSINPDEAVAYGSAVQAAILSRDQSPVLQDMLLIDVAPLSLGIRTTGGIMYKLIERNTIVPCKRVQAFNTYKENQSSVPILVYEGERLLTKDNNLLGRFDLTRITSSVDGKTKIDVTFDLDNNGILSVSAIDTSSGTKGSIIINKDRHYLSTSDVEKMVNDAKEFKEEDNKERSRIEAKIQLESFCFIIKKIYNILTEKGKLLVETKCKETLIWLENNLSADKVAYENKTWELKGEIGKIVSMYRISLRNRDTHNSQTSNECQPNCRNLEQAEGGSTGNVGILKNLKKKFNKMKTKLKG